MTCFQRTLVLTLSLGLLLFAGCREETPPVTPPEVVPNGPAEVPPPTPPAPEVDAEPEPEPTTRDQMRRDAEQAVETAARLAAQERDAFVAASRDRLDALQSRWDSWRDDAGERSAELKQELQDRYDAAAAKLNEVQDASGEAWTDLRAGFVTAYEELEAATRRAAASLADQADDAADDAAQELMDK